MNKTPRQPFIQNAFFRYLLATGLFLSVEILSLNAAPPVEEAAAEIQAKQQTLLIDFDATLRAFRGVAAIDWVTAMDLMASDEVKTTWKMENGDLFDSPIHSEAFFSHAIMLFSGDSEDHFTGGIYNLWADQWMLVDFTWMPEPREYQISAISWVLCNDKGVELSSISEAAVLEARLRKRLAHAIPQGHAAAKRGAAAVGGNRVETAQEAGKRIRAYATYMRGALAPDGAKAQLPLRTAIRNHRQEFPSNASPVFFTEQEDRRVVVFAAPQLPFELLFTSYLFDGKKMIFQQKSEQDMAPKGGQP
jgi:hypothetical protein